jgi:hypothetical protein
MLGSKLRRDVRCTSRLMRLRPLLLVLVALALVAGCGGDDNVADSSTNVDQLLQETFSGSKDIKSGELSASVAANSGSQSLAAKLGGPFESTGEGRLPKFDLDAALQAGGQSFEGGITSTGDQGFVSYAGTDYELAGPMYQQLKAGYEEQAKKSHPGGDQSLAGLGIDPRKWLTNAKNDGEAKVGDTDTIKITGDVDVPKLLDDVNTALGRVRSLGGTGAANLPDQLSAQDKRQAADAVKDPKVEIYTGADDKILRRLVVTTKLAAPGTSSSTRSADLKLDIQLLNLNEDQSIQAPENAKPFKDLSSKLRGLGLGTIGGGTSSSRGGATQKNLQKYSQCVQDANGDNDKIRKCADLLTP